jgi:hypothetical protein
MPWLKIDDAFPEHMKVVGLSDRAFRIHVSALCFCARNLTDGHVPEPTVRALTLGKKTPINDLVRAGLWHENGDGGFVINDYLDYNPSRAHVQAERERKQQAGRRGAEKRWRAA